MTDDLLRQILAVLVQNQLTLEALVATNKGVIPSPPKDDLSYGRMLTNQRKIIDGLEKAQQAQQ